MIDSRLLEAEQLFKQNYSLRKIEQITGLDRKKVSKHLKEKGYTIKARVGNSGYNKYEVFEQAKKIWLETGGSIKKICIELGTTPISFIKWLREQGYEIKPKSYARNEELEKQKLQEAVRLHLEEGYTLHEASRIVKINRSKLSDYLKDINYDSYYETRKVKYNESVFEQVDTEEKAYWLGFLYADGYINTSNGKYNLELTLKEEDYQHLVKFKNFMEAYDAEIKQKRVKTNDKIYKACKIILCGKKLCKDLIRLGCIPNKSLVLKFPTEEQVPKHLVYHFIRGYFDGDGTILLPKRAKWRPQASIEILGTKEFLMPIREIMSLSNTKFNFHGKAYGTKHGGNRQVAQFLNKLYGNANVYLDRKYELYKRFMTEFCPLS